MNLDPGLRLLWFPHILRFVLLLFVLCWPLPIICKVCKPFCLGQSRCSFQCTFLQRKNFVSNFNPLQVVFYPLRIIKIAKYCTANAVTFLNIWLKMNGKTLSDKLSRSAYLFHVTIYRIANPTGTYMRLLKRKGCPLRYGFWQLILKSLFYHP